MAFRFRTFVLSIVLVIALASGCGSSEVQPTVPTATPTSMASPREDAAPPPTPPAVSPGDPGEVVLAFYEWYLSYEGDPLADLSYKGNVYLADDFESEIERRIAESEMEGFDPFVCSREQPEAVELGTRDISGEVAHVIVNSVSGRHFFSVTLHVEGTEDPHWRITNVDCMIDAPPPESKDSPSGPRAVVEGWPVFIDEIHHFMIQYPEGWTYEDVDLDDPNKPPAGNMERLVMFYPEGWDQTFNPLHLEVYVMSDEAFGAERPPADRSETRETESGQELTVETYTFGEAEMTQYLWRSPSNPDIRVMVTDYLSGWPDRLEGNEGVAEAIDPMLASFGFTE